jgi:hypothetical protein
MITKTVRSRFSHEVGEKVEGCTILEKQVVIPPDPVEKRRGVYDYLVEVPPAPVKARNTRLAAAPRSKPAVAAEPADYTRAAPDEMPAGLIRRLPSR